MQECTHAAGSKRSRAQQAQRAQHVQQRTSDVIGAAVQRGVEQVLRCLLKAGQHEHAVLHLGDAEARDAQHLALRSSQAKSGSSLNRPCTTAEANDAQHLALRSSQAKFGSSLNRPCTTACSSPSQFA
jgi:hypothetical protein